MYNIVYSPITESNDFYAKWGDPRNIKFTDTTELSENEFWFHMTTHTGGPTVILNCFHTDDGWYGWGRAFWNSFDGVWMIAIRAEKHHLMHTERKVIYRKWSKCNHDFKLTKSQMCYKEYTCSLCGYKQAVDSSD